MAGALLFATIIAAALLAADCNRRGNQAENDNNNTRVFASNEMSKSDSHHGNLDLSGKLPAPELTGGHGWLNVAKPLTLKELRGKVVILDFWTFCCINCMHGLPTLHKLEKKYPDALVVIGVHSAKFANERVTDNIRNAILSYGIEHPVVNDSDFAIWNRYGVNAWPTVALIDPEGKVVFAAGGEAGEIKLTHRIGQ